MLYEEVQYPVYWARLTFGERKQELLETAEAICGTIELQDRQPTQNEQLNLACGINAIAQGNYEFAYQAFQMAMDEEAEGVNLVELDVVTLFWLRQQIRIVSGMDVIEPQTH